MISDGYGDGPDLAWEAAMEAELAKLTPLAGIMATEQTAQHPWLLEDARQEALIAAWQALAAEKSPGLVRADMRRAAINVDRGRSLTGNKRAPGRNGVDTHFRYGTPNHQVLPSGEETLLVEPVTDSPEDIVIALETVRERFAA